MNILKNSVGRPSKDFLKKRRLIYSIITIVIIFSLGGIGFLGYNLIKDNEIFFLNSASSYKKPNKCIIPYSQSKCSKEENRSVYHIQKMLNELNYYSGSATGIFDSKTTAAVKKYQESRGETQTGEIKTGLLIKLAAQTGYDHATIVYNKNGGKGTLKGTSSNSQAILQTLRNATVLSSTVLSRKGYTHVGWIATSEDSNDKTYYYGCKSKKCTSPTAYTSKDSKFVNYIFSPNEATSTLKWKGKKIELTAYYCENEGAKYDKQKSKCVGGTTKPIKYTITGTETGLIVDDVFYSPSDSISVFSISNSDTVFTKTNQKIKITGSFSSDIYSGINKDTNGNKCNSIQYAKYEVKAFNVNNKEISSINITRKINVAKESVVFDFKPSITYITINTYKPSNNCGKTIGQKNTKYSKKIYISRRPSIEATQLNKNVTKKSDYNYDVKKVGTYTTRFTINNSSPIKYYYKLFKFVNSISNDNIIHEGPCHMISGSSTKSFETNANITLNNSKIYQYVRVYKDEKTCKNDNSKSGIYERLSQVTRSDAEYINGKGVSYNYPNAYTVKNNKGYTTLKYDIENISDKIGAQTKSMCQAYSDAYGSYIIIGEVPKNAKGIVKNYIENYGGVRGFTNTYSQEYSVIKSHIDKGIPVIIHVKNSASQHWVLVVGYKTSKKQINNKKSDLLDNIWIIDPFHSTTYYGRKGVSLFHGPAQNRSRTVSTMYDTQYRTWNSRQQAIDYNKS